MHSSFVQTPPVAERADRGAKLGQLVRSRSASYLDAYLLIQAMASSNPPYEVWYPAQSWVHALGLNTATGSDSRTVSPAARSQWSKIIRKLVETKLITRHRSSNKMQYVLLDESGDGSPYVRSTKLEQGTWFMIPHAYWIDGHYMTMTLAAKAMLLVALSSKEKFVLPFDRVQDWYGLSASTARRGFKELEDLGILSYDQGWRAEPKSKTTWAEVRTYTLHGVWSLASRRKSISQRPPRTTATAPVFEGSKPTDQSSIGTPKLDKTQPQPPVSHTTNAGPNSVEAFIASMNERKSQAKKTRRRVVPDAESVGGHS